MGQMKPILFNTEMVKAILDGRKTVTRRLVKPLPVKDGRLWRLDGAAWTDNLDSVIPVPCHSLYNKAPFHPGDILYVRETWCKGKVCYGEEPDGRSVPFISQCVDEDDIIPKEWAIRHDIGIEDVVWKPSIHMPKEAARIFLRVTHVRMERLQSISADECPMEGVWPLCAGSVAGREAYYKTAFAKLWDSTIKPADLPFFGWEANPWVWVIKFERINKEEVSGDA